MSIFTTSHLLSCSSQQKNSKNALVVSINNRKKTNKRDHILLIIPTMFINMCSMVVLFSSLLSHRSKRKQEIRREHHQRFVFVSTHHSSWLRTSSFISPAMSPLGRITSTNVGSCYTIKGGALLRSDKKSDNESTASPSLVTHRIIYLTSPPHQNSLNRGATRMTKRTSSSLFRGMLVAYTLLQGFHCCYSWFTALLDN